MNNKVILALLATSIVGSATLTSCSDDDDDDKPAVAFAPNSQKISLYPDDTHQIELINSTNPTYEVDDDFFASVSETGLVTANHYGKTAIKVRDQGKTAIDTVDVNVTNICLLDLMYGQLVLELGTYQNVVEYLGEPESDKYTDSGMRQSIWKETYHTGEIAVLVLSDSNGKVVSSYIAAPTAACKYDPSLNSKLTTRLYMVERYNVEDISGSSYMYSYTPKNRKNYYVLVEFASNGTTLLYIDYDYAEQNIFNKSMKIDARAFGDLSIMD